MLCFFRAPATPNSSPLSLHDALPIFSDSPRAPFYPHHLLSSDSTLAVIQLQFSPHRPFCRLLQAVLLDRKSTRLNSSHVAISYAVFCLKKKKITVSRQPCYNSKNRLI